VNDFQYGPVIGDASGELGAQANFSFFGGGSNPDLMYSWIGATDNKGYFYQAGILYYPGCTHVYQLLEMDNYPNGMNNGLTYTCSSPGSSYHDVEGGNWLSVLIYTINNEWYYCNDYDGSSSCTAFPNGSDGGTSINSGAAVVITEGDDNATDPCTSSCHYYTQGATDEKDLEYVYETTESGGNVVIYVALSSTETFYDTSGSPGAPPDSSAWSDSSGVCDQYFDYATAGLPSYGASISACS
jgi:hypothetical protein